MIQAGQIPQVKIFQMPPVPNSSMFTPMSKKFLLFLLLVFLFWFEGLHAQTFYGLTRHGGANGGGAIIRMNGDGTGITTEYSFAIDGTPGRSSDRSPMIDVGGLFYGTTRSGGLVDNGLLFRFTPATGAYAKVYDFDVLTEGQDPIGRLVSYNNLLYGVTRGGGVNYAGTIYSVNPATGVHEKIFEFKDTQGTNPEAGMVLDPATNMMYGTTVYGGANGHGVLYRFNPATKVVTVLHDFFINEVGIYPRGELTLAGSSIFYGVCEFGGGNNKGTVFEFNAALGTVTKKADFSTSTGAAPQTTLLRSTNTGKYYGACEEDGASNVGTIFSFDPATNIIAKEFDFNHANGIGRVNYLVRAASDKMYGTCEGGGTNSQGALFEFTPSGGVYNKLLDFDGFVIGDSPSGGLTLASNGNYYGGTARGGNGDNGTLFEWNPTTNAIVRKIDFKTSATGVSPESSLVQASNGKLLGVTVDGGNYGNGVIFEFDPITKVYTKKFSFDDYVLHGVNPYGGLAKGNNGKFYGLTSGGGTGGVGALFEYDLATNTYTKRANFSPSNGSQPDASLTIVGDIAYGVTSSGGANTQGTIFEYNYVTFAFNKRYDFTNATGGRPLAPMVAASNGLLYGTTWVGGDSGEGVIYSYNPVSHTYSAKAHFSRQQTGAYPKGGLVEVDGKLYGVTTEGGANNSYGTLFEFDIATNDLKKVHDIDYTSGSPFCGLTRGAGKKIYGASTFMGVHGNGTVFEYDIAEDKFTITYDFEGPEGSHPTGGFLLSAKVPPVITGFTPSSGTLGSTVIITGSNFSANASENTVYFGPVKGTVTAATSIELKVTVPPGANFQRLSVTVNGLTTYASKPFVTTFPGGGVMVDSSFPSASNFTTGGYPNGIVVADLNLDGRPEVIVVNNTTNNVSVFPNAATQGILDGTSLGTRVDFSTGNSPVGVAAGDLDGDGKLDLVVANNSSNTVSVYRNLSTGNINSAMFGARVDFTVAATPFDVAIADIDLDGRPDIATANLGTSSLSVLRNTSITGAITASSFASKVDFTSASGTNSIKIWDIDGDNKPEVIVGVASGGISVYKNASTPGAFVAASLATKVDFSTVAINGFAIGDIDSDGKPDIAVASTGTSATTMSLFRNTATPGAITAASFAAKVDITVSTNPNVAMSDVDGDGKLDMVVSSRQGNSVRVYKNAANNTVGATTFPAFVTLPTVTGPGFALPADLDNDGKPDIISVNNTSTTTNTISVIRNSIIAAPPSVQPADINFTNVTAEGMTVGFTAASGADGYLALMSPTQSPNVDPVDAITYNLNDLLGNPTTSDVRVAYVGTNTSFTVEALPPSTRMYFAIYAYKGAASVINYLTLSPLTGDRFTLAAEPTVQASNISFSNVSLTSMTISFTNGNGSSRLVTVRPDVAVLATPVNGTGYTANTVLTGPQLGTDTYVVGTSSPVTVTGLSPAKMYHVKIFEFNGTGGLQNYLTTVATGNPASMATATPDTTIPEVTIIPLGSTASGAQVSLSATVVDNETTLSEVKLLFRSTSGGGTVQSVDMTKAATSNVHTGVIPPEHVGDLGVEYKVRAVSPGGTNESLNWISVPLVVPTTSNLTTLAYDAFGSEQTNYRIIAVPLQLTSKSVSSVFDELGGTDKKKWRLSHYNGTSNVELTPTDLLEPGLGYWLLVKNSTSMSTGGGTTVPTSDDNNFLINLTGGWNQVGNPYPFNILWSDVQAANPGIGALRTYRADNPAGGNYPWADSPVLRAKEGGFFNNTQGHIKLKFPPKKNSQAGRTEENPFVNNPLTDPNWQLYIVTKHNDLVNMVSGIGMREQASEHSDMFDGYTMPRFFDRYVELNHVKKTGDDFMSMDIVPPAGEYTWKFDIESSNTDRLITLEWDNRNFGDNDLGLILWDESRQIGVDMRTQSSYVFDRTVSHSFQVYFGNSEKLASKIEIAGLVLHSVSPNPAEEAVRVAFSVPDSRQVEVEAVDLLGRTVWNALGSFGKGYHEMVWEGENRSNAKGFYIIRLKSGDESKSARIYLK